MCGLMAACGKIDNTTVQRIVDQIRRRGPDAVGLAWYAENTGWTTEYHVTPSWPEPFAAGPVGDCKAGIAHARLATSGTKSIEDAQPLRITGNLIFAHNGTVYEHKELARKHQLPLRTHNDSEALAYLFLRHGAVKAMRLLANHQGPTNHAWIAALDRKMWIASFGQPLYYLVRPGVVYAASWRIPESTEVGQDTVLEWSV